MAVALFLPGLYEGGAERIVLNLADGIAARGYPVDLVLARAEGPYMPQVPRSVRLVDLEAPRVLGHLFTTWSRQPNVADWPPLAENAGLVRKGQSSER